MREEPMLSCTLYARYDIYAEWNIVSFNCFHTVTVDSFGCGTFYSQFHQGELTSESFQQQMCNSIIHYYNRFLIRILSKTSHLKTTLLLLLFSDDMTWSIAIICFFFCLFIFGIIKTNFVLMANVVTKHTTFIRYYFSDIYKYNDIKNREYGWLFREVARSKIQNLNIGHTTGKGTTFHLLKKSKQIYQCNWFNIMPSAMNAKMIPVVCGFFF